ncbi:receptor-like protein 9a [Hibiscus syriacus]|uniref:receptor-like protein 9a n=1 Tax=Hibiscus syriacus TaxID=106335 RepID=UPI001923AF01|nr:receptor-like protein 9a [Hibiscus syriacus]
MEITSFYRWFLVLLLYCDCQGCLEVERATLLQIKDSMTSLQEPAFSNWYEEECCEWEGIECGPTRTHIHNMHLLSLLEGSKRWRVSTLHSENWSTFKGWIPITICNRELNAEKSTWLLHCITSELWLGGNNLTGPFPWRFQNVSSRLTVLDISNNFLHGTLPRDIDFNLPHLRHLDLSNDSFNGSLPPFLGDQLQMLDLSDNQFQGEIPHTMVSNMSSLLYLRLSGNHLTGDLFPKTQAFLK